MRMNTRSRILDYLRKQQTASVRELSVAMGTTGANIRHHLADLETNGQVELISQRREERGRPVNIYGLSRQILGDGLADLNEAILDVWLKNVSETALENDLRSVALKLGGKNLSGNVNTLTIRLTGMTDRLNELHYQARWEAGVTGPTIILGYCPYAAIIRSNPELCRMDEFFLEQWVGSPVEQTAKLLKGAKGYPFCAFQVTSA